MSTRTFPAGETAQTRFAEVGVAIAVVFIIALLVVPLPPIMLDMFLSLSIGISLVVLLVALYTRDPNAPFMNESGKAACRLPSGHPEAFFEAFANVYRAAFDAMALRATGQKFEKVDTIYPNVYDGVEGMYFIQQCVTSSTSNGAWLPLRHHWARR